MTFGDFLKSRRATLNISQSELAARLNLLGKEVTKATVGHWERNRNNPPLDDPEFRKALASALEMDVNDMMMALGFIVTQQDQSKEARLAAQIVDQLPLEARRLAIDYLEVLRKRFLTARTS